MLRTALSAVYVLHRRNGEWMMRSPGAFDLLSRFNSPRINLTAQRGGCDASGDGPRQSERTLVKHSLVVLITITGVGAAATGLAGLACADSWEPTPPAPFTGTGTTVDKANVVISNLQGSNYKVILNKFGTAPLSACTVTGITGGQPQWTPTTAGAKTINQTAMFTTVFVTADCTRPITSPSSSG